MKKSVVTAANEALRFRVSVNEREPFGVLGEFAGIAV